VVPPPTVIGTVPEYTPVAWPLGFVLMVKVFAEVVAVIQLCVGVPAVIVGLDVELGLSVPSIKADWLAGTVPLLEENVSREGVPKRTGVFAAVTTRETDTAVVPLGVVMSMVAV
jgi:hypothetical protein